MSIGIFFVGLLALFFLSKWVINEFYRTFYHFVSNHTVLFSIISIIYLPGTIIHELSHFIAAMILLLKVRDITIIPQFLENQIKLGTVHYEKADVLRGFLVGIAPLFGGTLFFYMIYVFHLFPTSNIFFTAIMAYLIFSISSTMFSSKQDLVDFVYVLPIFAIIGIVIYLLNIDLSLLFRNTQINRVLLDFFGRVSMYVLYSIAINGGLLLFFKGIRYITKR